jgi:hypothetical protein
MTTSPLYPPPSLPMAATDLVAGWQNGAQVSMRMKDIAGFCNLAPPTVISSSTLTLDSSMLGAFLIFPAACVITVPSSLFANFVLDWAQTGTGTVRFNAGSGVTLESLSGALTSLGRGAAGRLWMDTAAHGWIFGSI